MDPAFQYSVSGAFQLIFAIILRPESQNIVAYLLKARIVKLAATAIAREQHDNIT
jgi:hypothetical protein